MAQDTFTAEETRFLCDLASIDRDIGFWAFDRMKEGWTVLQIKTRLLALAQIAGRE